ncbi:DUF6155 family protein [Evansella sp. AB-rgal1]|uniref:DUF6155 family protein n=1 Tax=Evansella sp. AB-rgal1 TaxID=3242696 RepID=UPI00359E28A5
MTTLKVGELNKALKDLNQKELIQLIADLYKVNKDAQQFLSAKFLGETAVEASFTSAKRKIQDEFFPNRGEGKLRLSVAKKAISDFKKLTNDSQRTVDLMLYYVELGTEFSHTYGYIDDSFYSSMVSMYEKVVDECIKDEKHYHSLNQRMYNVLTMSQDDNYSYAIAIESLYLSIEDYYEDEDEIEN